MKSLCLRAVLALLAGCATATPPVSGSVSGYAIEWPPVTPLPAANIVAVDQPSRYWTVLPPDVTLSSANYRPRRPSGPKPAAVRAVTPAPVMPATLGPTIQY